MPPIHEFTDLERQSIRSALAAELERTQEEAASLARQFDDIVSAAEMSTTDDAFRLVDVADAETVALWNREGVASRMKGDGTPVTAADVASEQAMLAALRRTHPNDARRGSGPPRKSPGGSS